jgi:hypothetical protein
MSKNKYYLHFQIKLPLWADALETNTKNTQEKEPNKKYYKSCKCQYFKVFITEKCLSFHNISILQFSS